MKPQACSLFIPRLAQLLLLFGFIAPGSMYGAAYIKIGDIKGEALAAGYQDWSDLSTVDQSIERKLEDGSVRTRGPAEFSDILCTKVLDKASPKVAEAVANGKVFPKVEIHLTRNGANGGGQVPYLVYELSNVSITSYTLFGQGNTLAVNNETFALNFEEITMTYMVYKDDGSSAGNVEFNWKVEEGTN